MRFLLINTATPTCRMTLVNGDEQVDRSWEAGRMLAKSIFVCINEILSDSGVVYDDLDGLGVFRGPGSFTGLRIGLTVANTIASTKNIPIVGETGDEWRRQAVDRLVRHENDKIVLPEYGSDARITKPRK